MKILGIETSCDETAASIVEISPDSTHTILISQSVATSLSLHAKTGGIIPEIAARSQIQSIIPVIYIALYDADIPWDQNNPPAIDAIAVTYGPGLIGSLLVGVETAKSLSYLWNKPLIPVNHLFGHVYANFVRENSKVKMQDVKLPEFPAIALIVSGGHTDLLFMKSHSDIIWLGGTRDDAAGEAFDKIGRLLDLPYPAGPMIEKLAEEGDSNAYHFPRPLMYDGVFDFSFSGLKTAVLREVQNLDLPQGKKQLVKNICRGVQDAIIDVLVKKTLTAAEKLGAKSILLGGGVAANATLTETLKLSATNHKLSAEIFVPQKSLCTDNAAMIATAGFFQMKHVAWNELTANPQLYFDETI